MDFTRGFLKGKDVVLANVLRDSSCGHLFECIEYYYLFKTEYVAELGRPMRPAIYLAYDNFTKDDLRKIVENKYCFTPAEVDNLLEDTLIETISEFTDKKIQDFREVNTVVFVEGYDLVQIRKKSIFFVANNIIAIRCTIAEEDYGELDFPLSTFKVLQDFRIYGDALHSFKTKHHIKKLLFNKLKLFKYLEPNTAFMYLSTDCRELPEDYVEKTLNKYPQFSKIYVSVLDKESFKHLETDRVKFLTPPIKNFHGLFETMIYMPVGRKFDCSSRLIPECVYYNKKIIYHDIDYVDKGLEIRKKDCTSLFNNLYLDREDNLFKEVGRQCLCS